MPVTLSRDPYKTFRFRVYLRGTDKEFGDEPVAAVSSVSAITQTTESIEYRGGNDPLALKTAPGQTNYEPVTLEKGLTANKEFHDWAQKIDPADFPTSADANKVEYELDCRKDVKVVLCDEQGRAAVSVVLENCWISKYTALPDLDAGDNAIAIESLTFEYEGWDASKEQSKGGGVSWEIGPGTKARNSDSKPKASA